MLEAVELLAYPLRVDSVEVVLDLGPDLPSLQADPNQLHQVIVNLVTNAHQAMRGTAPPRRLTLATRHDREQGRVALTVADTGPEIAPEIQSRIFEPFFTTKPVGQGTGLGLSISRGIVESHGGAIRAESEPGRGARFVVELPAIGARVGGSEREVPEGSATATGRRILVVDDEPAVAELLAEMLALDGHQVDTADHGCQALERLKAEAYGLVLTDVKMPVLDGPGLYREAERVPPALARRFLFVAGVGLTPATREFLERTGASTLGKPFDQDDVRRVVRLALAKVSG